MTCQKRMEISLNPFRLQPFDDPLPFKQMYIFLHSLNGHYIRQVNPIILVKTI